MLTTLSNCLLHHHPTLLYSSPYTAYFITIQPYSTHLIALLPRFSHHPTLLYSSTEARFEPSHELARAEIADIKSSSVRGTLSGMPSMMKDQEQRVSSKWSLTERGSAASGVSQVGGKGRYWFDRCRGVISDEVQGSLAVPWQRSRLVRVVQWVLLWVLVRFPRSGEGRTQKLRGRLGRHWNKGDESAEERKYRHAFLFIRRTRYSLLTAHRLPLTTDYVLLTTHY